MILKTAQAVAEQAHDHVGQTLLTVTGGSLVFGIAIETVNKYLQAGAFITTMIVGVAAFLYYRAKTREINGNRKDTSSEDR